MLHTNISVNENGGLAFAGIDIKSLAEKYGTPLYLLDEDRIREKCRIYVSAMRKAFGQDSLPTYASKALCFKGIYSILKEEGLGADVVSYGEMYTALAAGFPADKLFFHGDYKSDFELNFAIDNDIGAIMVDNAYELGRISDIAAAKGKTVNIIVRLTPGIDPHTFSEVNTGRLDCQFGTPIEADCAKEMFMLALHTKNVNVLGMHCHIGSQVFTHEPFALAADKMLAFISEIKRECGYEPNVLDIGGGFAVRYVESDKQVDIAASIALLGKEIDDMCKKYGVKKPAIYMEPGRSIVADAGMTVYTAGAVKEVAGLSNYIVVDGGMSDNPRYALYKSSYTVYNASRMNDAANTAYTVAGRACEPGDIIQKGVMLPKTKSGDLICVAVTGAYNYSMASNYNRIPKPPIVMLKGGEDRLAVKRETADDMLKNEL